MTEQLHTFLRSRRSVRRFKPDLIPEEAIRRILETTLYAPSAHNLQPWRFVILTSLESKSLLAQAITDKFRTDMVAEKVSESDIQTRIERTIKRIREAPTIIILCRDTERLNFHLDPYQIQKEIQMATQSVAAAGLQLLLAAHAEGLGGTWVCWPLYASDETRRALGIDNKWDPQGMIFLGYPAKSPATPERVAVEEVTLFL